MNILSVTIGHWGTVTYTGPAGGGSYKARPYTVDGWCHLREVKHDWGRVAICFDGLCPEGEKTSRPIQSVDHAIYLARIQAMDSLQLLWERERLANPDADVLITDLYWDCECEADYIHPKTVFRCPQCQATADEMPDSRYTEVLEAMMVVR